MTAQYTRQGDIAIILLDNPPVNGLNLATRTDVVTGIEKAQADDAIKAVVLMGHGSGFSAGADIAEFGTIKALQEPNLRTVIVAVENCTKPVVAALHGTVMGGGLELALGCHYRVVAPGTKIAFPEVKLGLLPGAGGTQRLPRTLGVENALNLIVSGETVKSDMLAMAPGQRLFDKVAGDADGLQADALALAAKVAADHVDGKALPRVRDWPCEHPQGEAYFQFVRTMVKAQSAHYPAPLKCVEAVEAATKEPFDWGLATEAKLFGELMISPESAALRHAFMAQRAAGHVPDVGKDIQPRKIAKVGVIGAGTMGGGIATVFLNAGIPVTLLEARQEALDHGVATMRKNYEGRVKKGKMKTDVAEQRMALLTPTLAYDDLKDLDLVVEAVFESLEVKESVFKQLDKVAKAGAILATNTSTLDINQIAAITQRPQDVLGMHFFSPAPVMPLLEVVRADKTGTDVLASVMALAKRIRKTAVVARVCDGFIGNRMIDPYARQAGFLLDEGASVEQIDRAIEKFGFAMGPFRMSDLAGNDISEAIRQRHVAENPDLRYSGTAEKIFKMGRLGQKTGAGWYDYVPGKRDPVPSPAVHEMIDKHRKELDITPRKIDDQEIVDRLVYALVNEGARILEEGVASKASDIDVVYLMGYGFPPWRGGPMHYADHIGLYNVVQTMHRLARNPADAPGFWEPAPLLARLASQGKTFN